jgi:predicted nucleic acid-binding protein
MRFVLDTQVYIEALRAPVGNAALGRLHEIGSYIWLNAVVACELLAGMPAREGTPREVALMRRYLELGLVVVPSFTAWRRAGEAIAALHTRGLIDKQRVLKSFMNDLLIAASCAEEEITLVTKNTRDFALIAEEIPFRFTPPWPPFPRAGSS